MRFGIGEEELLVARSRGEEVLVVGTGGEEVLVVGTRGEEVLVVRTGGEELLAEVLLSIRETERFSSDLGSVEVEDTFC